MPYVVKPAGNGYVLAKKDGGKVMGRHTTKAKAEAQRRAIHANEKKR